MNAKSIIFFVLFAAAPLALSARPAAASSDPSAPSAIVDWEPSSSWSVGLTYAHRMRPVEVDANGPEWTIAGESYDAFVAFSWNWLELRAFGGATQAHLKEYALKDLDPEAGGGASLAINLWQISPEEESAWRALLRLEGRGEWRTTSADNGESLEWFEGFAALPLHYTLSTTRSRRNSSIRDFHALGVYIGPAFSVIDGRRELGGTETSFEQSDLYGAVGGVQLWLLRNLEFGGRLEYFGDCTWSLGCTYVF